MFPCNRCGACCRSIKHVPELKDYDRGDGACKYLVGEPGQEHTCSIYETRPDVCRVDKSKPILMSTAEWYRANLEACTKLRLNVYGQDIEVKSCHQER